MIAAGTRLTMSVKGETTNTIWNPLGFQTDDLRSGVLSLLSSSMTVNSLGVTARSTIYTGYLGWPYTATITITTRTAYAKAEDLASIIANAFYQAAGSLPTVNVQGYPSTGAYTPGESATSEPPAFDFGLALGGLGIFGLAAIAVAIVVWKNT
jgi:hypothetical protein